METLETFIPGFLIGFLAMFLLAGKMDSKTK